LLQADWGRYDTYSATCPVDHDGGHVVDPAPQGIARSRDKRLCELLGQRFPTFRSQNCHRGRAIR
jgi:hypothetical protein